MAGKTQVQVPGLGDSSRYGYVQCVTAGNLVFPAGQTDIDANYDVISDEFGPQARRALLNIQLALKAAGADFEDIVPMTIFITDMRYASEFLEVRRELMGDTPCPSAMVGISQLAHPNLLVEVQVIAVRR